MRRVWKCSFVSGVLSLVLGACGDSNRDHAPPMAAQTSGVGASGTGTLPVAGAVAPGSAGTDRPDPPIAGRGSTTPAPVAGASGMSGAGRAGAMAAGGGGRMATAGGGAGGSSAGAGGAAPLAGGGGATSGAAGASGGSMLPPTTDYTQKGPFMTTMTSNVGPGSNYTIFRPDPLGANGFMHPPIIFGPGIITSPSQYRVLLTHLASHGYVTICVNSLTGGPNAPGNLEAMKMGLDWLIEQHAQAGVFQGKLAVDRAVTMGYSIGSTASVQLSSHPAIATTVAIHGHNTKGDPHGPVLLLTGTMDVIDDVRATLGTLEEAPAVLAALPIGHLEVLGELAAGGRYIAPITAWLRYWVNGDQDAKRFFWGADCEMCSTPWIAPEKNAKWDGQML